MPLLDGLAYNFGHNGFSDFFITQRLDPLVDRPFEGARNQ